jgi:flagellar biosynthesis protein FlhF
LALPVLAAEWPALPETAAAPRVIALIGPPGVGKTASIAKLAFRFGIEQRQSIAVLSADNLRVGASDQLGHLCGLMGIPFQAISHFALLPAALHAEQRRAVILIDTPGLTPEDEDLTADLARHLRAESHLVLPATLRLAALRRRFAQFASLSPSHLLFSRLDEAEPFGPVWDLVLETGLPVRWMSTGPRVPEDLIDAGPESMAIRLLGTPVAALTRAVGAH